MTNDVPVEILELCARVTAKRPRTVIDHILQYGFITTEDLKNTYGYDHPPRATQDVKDQGIPLVMFKVKSSTTGRKIAAYKFGDVSAIKTGRIGGRKAFPKNLKRSLVEVLGSRCTLTGEYMEERYLQIDHRIPYEIAGNNASLTDTGAFMLLDASSQRAKSWSCEHCENFTVYKSPEICQTCFWASPDSYTHVAMKPERRLHLVWTGKDTATYDILERKAAEKGVEPQILAKEYIASVISNSK